MAKTLSELMTDCGLESGPNSGQTKHAAAPSSTTEVDQVLKNLGLEGTENVKTASENVKPNGGNMATLTDIYQQIMGDSAPAGQTKEAAPAAEAGSEKTAAEATPAATPAEGDDSRTVFGGLVGHYFNEALNGYVKTAGDLEAEAGKGELPLQHIQPEGQMTKVIGKESDPMLPMNHSGSSNEKIDAAVKNTTPYNLKGAALKEVLKRLSAAQPGGSYEQ